MKDIAAYTIEPQDFRNLRRINERLYDDRPITPDQRRDLANLMHTLLERAEPLTQADVGKLS